MHHEWKDRMKSRRCLGAHYQETKMKKMIVVWVLSMLSLTNGFAADEWQEFVAEQKAIYEAMQSAELKAVREAFADLESGLDSLMKATIALQRLKRDQPVLGRPFRHEVVNLALRPQYFSDEWAVKIIRDWVVETLPTLRKSVKEMEGETLAEGLPTRRKSTLDGKAVRGRFRAMSELRSSKRALELIDKATDALSLDVAQSEEAWLTVHREKWLPIHSEWCRQLQQATRRVKTEGSRDKGNQSHFVFAKLFLKSYEGLNEITGPGRRAHTMKTMRGWANTWEVGGGRSDGRDPFGDPLPSLRRRR